MRPGALLVPILLVPLPLVCPPTAAQEPRTPWDAGTHKQVLELLDAYFKPAADRAALLEKLKAYDGIPAPQVRKILDHAARLLKEGPRAKPDARGLCTLQHPTERGTYYLAGGEKAARKPQAVVIALHGGGPGAAGGQDPAMSGTGAMRIWNPKGTPLADAIVVGPNQPGERDRAWTDSEGGARFVRAVLEEVKRTFPVDTNRVYLAGHSLGGFGSWYIGSLAPDVFAGVAGGGCTPYGVLENLRSLPCYQYWGPDDPHREYAQYYEQNTRRLKELAGEYGGYDPVLRSYEGIGHGFPPEGHGPIFQWLSERARNPCPRKVVWKPGAPSWQRGCYWLWGARDLVVAELTARNTIDLRGAAGGVTVLLSEPMVSLKDPVTIRVEGKEVFKGIVQPSLLALVLSLEEWKDANHVFTARVQIP